MGRNTSQPNVSTTDIWSAGTAFLNPCIDSIGDFTPALCSNQLTAQSKYSKTSTPAVVAIETRRSPAIHPPFRTVQVLHGPAVGGAHSTTPTAWSWWGKPKYEQSVALRNLPKQAAGKGRLVLTYDHAWGV